MHTARMKEQTESYSENWRETPALVLLTPVKERVLCERLIKFPKPWAASFLSLYLYLTVKSCSVVVHLLEKER